MLLLVTMALAQEAPPIVNGTTTRDYAQVVTLWADDGRGYGYNFCSGTLIADDWVVTAAHCVEAMDENERYGYGDLWILVGYDLNSDSGVQDMAQASRWIAHSSYSSSTLANDIGLVELATPITSIDFMPVNKDAIRSSDVGDDYRYVGWGITSDSGQDSTKKRTADMPLYDYDSTFIYTYDTADGQNVCSGDSGGAALEILGNGQFELAGVNSFVFSPNYDSTPCAGGASGATRVDQYVDWIENYTPVYSAAEVGGGGDTGDPDTGGGGDTDTGGGGDTDTGGGGGDTDTDPPDGGGGLADMDEDPVRPDEVGEDYATESLLGCSTAGVGEAWGLAALAGAVGALRRRRTQA